MSLPYTDLELDVAARTVWGEARGEKHPEAMLAVAWVIRNRVEHPRWWGKTIAEVCRKPYQFSCWNDDDPNAAKCHAVDDTDVKFLNAKAAVAFAFQDISPDPTGGSDHYCTTAVEPNWAKGKEPVATIGNHRFYRLEI